jgi:hypothetical protein
VTCVIQHLYRRIWREYTGERLHVPMSPYLQDSGSTWFCLDTPLLAEVPKEYWKGADPGPVWAGVEICSMPVITGEPEEDFHGTPWNVCVYTACLGYQKEGFMAEVRDHARRADGSVGDLAPWFVWDARSSGHHAPIFQASFSDEESAEDFVMELPGFLAAKVTDLLECPVNAMGSNGWDWLRGDLVSRPALANMVTSGKEF